MKPGTSDGGLLAMVRQELEGWEKWSHSPHPVLTPVRFLAIVLWMLTCHLPDEEERAHDAAVVDGWAKALQAACSQGVVRMLDPVALVPMEQEGGPDWVMTVADAQVLLDQMPLGFNCGAVLEHFRTEALAAANAAAEAPDFKTWAEVAAYRRRFPKGKEPSWDERAQRTLLREAYLSRGGGNRAVQELADELGKSRQSVARALERQPAVVGRRGPQDAGPSRLQDTWAGRAAGS